MLSLENISLGYSKTDMVLNSIDFDVADGEYVAIVGPNGSGKSTLLRAIAGTLRPMAGTVRLNGRDVKTRSHRSLARKIAFLPQSPTAPGDYTIKDLVSYGRFPHLNWTGSMTRKDWDIVNDALERTHLTSLTTRYISTLSGGERQRAWIAMALAQQPEVLILDEPTTYLDISFQFEVLELIRALNASLNITILMVIHDLNQAARFSRRIIALNQGRVVVDGPPEKLLQPKMIEDIFHISVGIESDPYNNCPYVIPIQSRRIGK